MTITPCLWFDGDAEAAARHYVGIFDDAVIGNTAYYGANMPMPAGTVLLIDFTLRGQPFQALNGGRSAAFSDAMSLSVDCASQAEIDHHWDGLIAGGGTPVMCGWLRDRFGVAWQIVPRQMAEWQRNGQPEQVARMMAAMMTMVKLDLAALRAAFAGE